ncbi:hypothetical protein NQZ68_014391 [Dissostichus eleginoides]|nr:hypothetical protein NQZ68_014391 [Dissostichus eleginoides]
MVTTPLSSLHLFSSLPSPSARLQSAAATGGLLLPSCFAKGNRKQTVSSRVHGGVEENRLMVEAEAPLREGWLMLPPVCSSAPLWIAQEHS